MLAYGAIEQVAIAAAEGLAMRVLADRPRNRGQAAAHTGGKPADDPEKHEDGDTMRALKATGRGERLPLEEPTDLPDESEVRVELAEDDDLDDGERSKLHAAILAGEAELDTLRAASEGERWLRLRAAR